MLHRTVIAGALAALVCAAVATAAQPPLLGSLHIISAGQTTPVDVAGNNLHRGATIRRGTELRRWLVTLRGRSDKSITLRCGQTAKLIGLGQQDQPKLYLRVQKGSRYGRRTIDVQFRAAPRVDPNTARASVYALCKTA